MPTFPLYGGVGSFGSVVGSTWIVVVVVWIIRFVRVVVTTTGTAAAVMVLLLLFTTTTSTRSTHHNSTFRLLNGRYNNYYPTASAAVAAVTVTRTLAAAFSVTQQQQQQQQQQRQHFTTTPRSKHTTTKTNRIIMATAAAAAAAASSSSSLALASAAMTTTTTTTTTTTAAPDNTTNILATLSLHESIASRLVNTWIRDLSPETFENRRKSLQQSGITDNTNDTNRSRRPVYNGHYVPVTPTGLPNPRLLLYSHDVVHELLGWTTEQINNDNDNTFVQWLSGNLVIAPITINSSSDNNNNNNNNIPMNDVDDQVAAATPSATASTTPPTPPTPTPVTVGVSSWATGYALSIMGTKYTNNCTYGTGDGYGDGRAISIGEIQLVVNHNNNNNTKTDVDTLELQIKGAGKTPYCRGADGRAVLRSSLREFLASEAMHYLGINTTRAVSLIVSDSFTIQRPWYREAIEDNNNNPLSSSSNNNNNNIRLPTVDDPRLAHIASLEERKRIINQVRQQHKEDPNIMISEPAAMTTRAASSFCRIGHLDLHSRRVEQVRLEIMGMNNNKDDDDNNDANEDYYSPAVMASRQWRELEQMIEHAIYREYRNEISGSTADDVSSLSLLARRAEQFLNLSAERLAGMVAGWLRVGFAQGNFNADNCLVGGKTMDYGPFGWMEEYNPIFAKWTGSGQHYGFLNQPAAGFANYRILVESVVPILVAAAQEEQKKSSNNGQSLPIDPDRIAVPFLERAAELFQSKADQVFRVKLGFTTDQDVADELWLQLEPLLRSSRADYVLFFRELTYAVRDMPPPPLRDIDDSKAETAYYEKFLTTIEGNEEERTGSCPFYEPLSVEERKQWLVWIRKWHQALLHALDTTDNDDNNTTTNEKGTADPKVVQGWMQCYERMRTANPKFVLREWMLVDAYQAAANGEEAELYSLYNLIQHPYDEGSSFDHEKYYRRAPDEVLMAAGTAFMS